MEVDIFFSVVWDLFFFGSCLEEIVGGGDFFSCLGFIAFWISGGWETFQLGLLAFFSCFFSDLLI